MSFKIDRGPMTPMYETIWNALEKEYNSSNLVLGNHKLNVISNKLGTYIEIIGLKRSFWYHICHPRILYNFILNKKFVIYNMRNTATFNLLSQIKCKNCNYELTKAEQMMIKLAILGEKIK